MPVPRLRGAVVGVGRMGANHARVLSELAQIEFVGVADTALRSAREIARRYGVPAYGSAEELLRETHPDVVAIAVPTQQHLAVARVVFRAGAHVLLEKPIADDLPSARAIMREAGKAKRRLFVGHIERFNPAVIELARRLRRGEAGRILQIVARRLSTLPPQVQDTGVLIDLGTHDLDVMRFLLGAEAELVWAVSRRHTHPSHEDLLVATVLFPGKVVGLMELSWLTPTKVRELAVLGDRGMFVVDYLVQRLVFYENALVPTKWTVLGTLVSGVGEGRVIRYPVEQVEPLRAEWEAFIRAVQGKPSTVVTGEEALRTLALATAIARSAKTNRVVRLTKPERRRDG